LITRPEHDPGTRYLSRWSEEVIDAAKKKGIDVTDLCQKKAVRKELEGRIKRIDPSFILFNGHGGADCVTGHDNEVLIKAEDNHSLLKNRVTYAVSCNSAQKLGAVCADKNTAYIGYDESFIFNIDRTHLRRPLEDQRAAQFLEASNQVSLLLIKGHAVKEACNGSKKVFKDAIKKLLPSINNDPFANDDIADLFWDMNHLVCMGDGTKQIV